MKRFNQLQHNSEIPNPEPVKHSEKSYGTIKAFGICTNQGLIRTYNEDRVSIILNIVKPDEPKAPPCSIFSLFDGHGGSKCADFLRNNLHNNVKKAWEIVFSDRVIDSKEQAFSLESARCPQGSFWRNWKTIYWRITCEPLRNLRKIRVMRFSNGDYRRYMLYMQSGR
jgi:hypothetical protein